MSDDDCLFCMPNAELSADASFLDGMLTAFWFIRRGSNPTRLHAKVLETACERHRSLAETWEREREAVERLDRPAS